MPSRLALHSWQMPHSGPHSVTFRLAVSQVPQMSFLQPQSFIQLSPCGHESPCACGQSAHKTFIARYSLTSVSPATVAVAGSSRLYASVSPIALRIYPAGRFTRVHEKRYASPDAIAGRGRCASGYQRHAGP